MVDRTPLFPDDGTYPGYTATQPEVLTQEQYRAGPVNYFTQVLGPQTGSLKEETGIGVTKAPSIRQEEAREDDPSPQAPSAILAATRPTLGGGISESGKISFDIPAANPGRFKNYSDYLKSSDNNDRISLVDNIYEGVFDPDKEVQLGKGLSGAIKEGQERVSGFSDKLKDKDVQARTGMVGLAATQGAIPGGVAATMLGGTTVKNAFGKNSYRPVGLLGAFADMVHSRQYVDMNYIRAARRANPYGDTGFAMSLGNFGITRRPGSGSYTGNMRGMDYETVKALEALSKGYDPIRGRYNMLDPSKSQTVFASGGLQLSNNPMDGFFRANGSVYNPRFMGTGQASAAYASLEMIRKAARTYGVTPDTVRDILADARAGIRTVQQGMREANAPYFDDSAGYDYRGVDFPDPITPSPTERTGQGSDDDYTAYEPSSFDRGDTMGDYDDEDPGGARYGGRIGLAMGGAPRMASGFVERPPDQVPEDQTVADDKKAQLPEGAFVINAAAAEFMGTDDVRKMLLDAHKEALRQGLVVDKQGNGAKLIDVAISRGEVVVAPHLAKIIGYDRLTKINNRGKSETRERIQENGQQPIGVAEGGFIPQPTLERSKKKRDEALADVELRADLEEFIRDDQLARLGWSLYTSGELMVAGFPTPFDYTRVTEGEGKDAKETVRDKSSYLISGTHTPIPGRNTRPFYEGSDKIVKSRTSINQREEIAERLNKIGVEPSAEIPIISYFAEPQYVPKYARSDPERYMGDKATVMITLAHELRHAALNYLHFEHGAPRLSLEREERLMDYFDDKARNQASEKNALVSAESPYEILQARGVAARYTSKNKEQAELFNELATEILKERGVPPVAQPKEKGYISKFLDNLFD